MANDSAAVTGPGERPNGDGIDNSGNAPVDPATLGHAGTVDNDDDDNYRRDSAGNLILGRDGKPKRKPGRKSGGSSGGGSSGGNSTRKAAPRAHDLKASIDGLASMLSVLHGGVALFAKVPEMALTDEEAGELAKATVPVLEQFEFVPDPKYAAIFGLIMVAGKIYVPRGYLIRERLREEADNKRANAARPVN